jgi:hypothetical protein
MAMALGRAGRRAGIGAFVLAGTAAVLALGFAGAAEAHGRGGRASVYFSFGAPYAYYPPPYYVAPRYYYPPPPVVYAPPPVVYAPSAQAPAPVAPVVSQEQCREYQAPAVVGGEPGNTYGTACLQPDGSWRIVR